MRRTTPMPIRKRPRRFYKFIPHLSIQRQLSECDYCADCMAAFEAQAESSRPGHVWTIVDGKIVYMEDAVAESMLGRALRSTEVVVHKDNNPLNNTRNNLDIVAIPEFPE